jgi:HlyD family secretion protein
VQGYVEGEYVYVASAQPGDLQGLKVVRGAQVQAGDLLFELDGIPQKAARDEAERRLANARSTWEDLKKGRRPTEIESLTAQLQQAKETLGFAEVEMSRQAKLAESKAGSEEELQRARSTRNENAQRVAQFEADLKTAKLGARDDQIAAAEAMVRALEAALAQADWNLSQMRQAAPKAGLVIDTLYREGEWVAAGKPVVQLLPPENVKVRAFVPEPKIGTIHQGDEVRVTVDGVNEPFVGRVSFVSPRAEFTPPVIYSRESRTKLVFMIEAVFPPESAAKLHPGQPVDCRFGGS